MSDILKTQALAIGYGPAGSAGRKTVADDLDLAVAPGEFVCLLGPNGAGKSTLLRTLAGLQPRLGGGVAVAGEDLARLGAADRARLIAVVLTEKAASPSLRVRELVSSGRHPHTGWFGKLTPADERIITDSLALVGAAQFAGRLVGDLSDGERQRVMIARALAQTPKLLLLDEITAFLDLPSRVRVMSLLRRLARERGAGIVLSSHDLDLSLRLADKIWLMQGGRPLRIGAPEDLALSGALKGVFDTDEIHFDRETGAFALEQPQGPAVFVRGEGLHRTWTLRALARAGYSVVEQAGRGDAEVAVRTAAPPIWTVTVNEAETECGSLDAVIETLDAAFFGRARIGAAA